ncbi:photosynthetic NDH subunit of subcomplex B 5, chloroplastic-like [Asparagus officinalis]|uniref:photosynthetic NDH subunit of subcomplex B 5, chloroplastic-like n=1 Tax=Asparagus officinalis TaxID=4686 RepID=UPI00098E2699|nr:photosynthetic NDH subunit of subcomplex B 5, chloroplastic-like [Asparagus officinalis]
MAEAVAAGLAYNVPGEYLYIGAAVFVVIFCGIEMGKPDKAHNFEPGIYNMERGARDKLIADYNTMDIWDFNEKTYSWLFLPAVAAGLDYNVPGEYLYIGAAVFVVIFCGIEMGKPDKAHNFEPGIYNMERGARDKLIADYNTMDIWDFNEKYAF